MENIYIGICDIQVLCKKNKHSEKEAITVYESQNSRGKRGFKEWVKNAYESALSEFPNSNPFQPGFIREYILSDELGHSLNPEKKGVDAWDRKGNGGEYKTFKIGGWGRFNFQANHGYEKHLEGIPVWYFAQFDSPFTISRIWSVPIESIREYCADFMKRSKSRRNHRMVDFRVKWIERNGEAIPLRPSFSESSFIQNLRMVQDIENREHGYDSMGYSVNDISLKGRIGEMLIAEILGHKILTGSKGADAIDDEGNEYEYLSSLHGKFQMTHMTEENSHNKVFRNKAIYCALFENPASIQEIWEIEPEDYMKRMNTRRPWPEDQQNNFTVPLKWVREVGERVFPQYQ